MAKFVELKVEPCCRIRLIRRILHPPSPFDSPWSIGSQEEKKIRRNYWQAVDLLLFKTYFLNGFQKAGRINFILSCANGSINVFLWWWRWGNRLHEGYPGGGNFPLIA